MSNFSQMLFASLLLQRRNRTDDRRGSDNRTGADEDYRAARERARKRS